MPTFANALPSIADDNAYCVSVPLPLTEGDLGSSIQMSAAAAVGATSLAIAPFSGPALPNGTILTFLDANSNPVQVTLTATLLVNATLMSVSPLVAALPALGYALNQGEPFMLPAGAEALLAVVQLVAAVSASVYVAMQTDLGDGVWVDVAVTKLNVVTGTTTFAMSSGLGGGSAPGAQRANGTTPAANISNAMPLGARVRFTGQLTSSSSSSSSSSGAGGSGVRATIKYKVKGMR